MKIQKTVTFNTKLIFFKLIQSKILNKNHYLKNITLSDVKYRLKKILFIIFKYHTINKRILFIGVPINKLAKLKSFSNHIFLPKQLWVNGAINNKKSYFHYLNSKKTVDLIIILDNFSEAENIINESYVSKIPYIIISNCLNIHSNKLSYKVPGNFQFYTKKLNNIFFFISVNSIKKKCF